MGPKEFTHFTIYELFRITLVTRIIELHGLEGNVTQRLSQKFIFDFT